MAVENARLFDEVQRLATLDGLTGTYNRRHFMDVAKDKLESARRFSQPFATVMLDVDLFKSVNDRHGHAVGDQVLRAVAERCRSALRSIDALGRYGGEEFAIVLPGTAAGAALVAERIRRAVADEPIQTDAGPVHVTISLGVAEMNAQTDDLAAVLKRADAALYEAKQAGRNRVA
jgi:diguanylate cyclase (GGDEF)-like protein